MPDSRPDNREERRRQDLRDFEFYKKRLRPTSAELWRLIKKPQDPVVITEEERRLSERYGRRWPPREPAQPTDTDRDIWPREKSRFALDFKRLRHEMLAPEVIWPLASAAIVLALLASTGKFDRAMLAFVL